MTKKTLTGSEKLDRLTDVLVEDVLLTSDLEIFEEAKELYGDPEVEASRISSLLDQAIIRASKAKLINAKTAVAAQKVRQRNNVVPLSSATKRAVVNRFVAQDQDLQQKLTFLAARKGEGVETDNDIDGMFEDLVELGIIDEQGNPT